MKLLTRVEGAEVVASGSNANGEWLKFGNGTMIQYGVFEQTISGGTQIGSVWYVNAEKTFPQEFYASDFSLNSMFGVEVGLFWVGTDSYAFSDKAKFRLRILSPITIPNTALKISWTAIGKWK